MGCFLSSDRSSHSPSSLAKSNDCQAPRSSLKAAESRAPPPEEETVKEVLSETPKWKPSLVKFEAEKPVFEEQSKVEKPFLKVEEISEVSEVCSLSESISTTTATDKREEEEELIRRVNGSPARMRKNRSYTGGRTERSPAGKSPARRSEQSPARRNAGRGFQSRDQQMGNAGTWNQPHRRDAGEKSGRRSRSPATRTDYGAAPRSVVGRSPSTRRTNQSPARVRAALPESGGRKVENSTVEDKWPSSSANESLENPLVSLECFIFL
ncbi:uncharacterized protein LOC130726772 [Lotus japonicus]|uniref:uncharacterized protein LOC130726772 n=1 Tax=Lotus japonicus TaxID=34305 RepID=UPI002585801E|nr:uncharacterized protein LOC130726772 [Lotus japonicus]